MAILSDIEKMQLRQELARRVAVNYTKPEINAALQAIEDWFENNRAGLVTAINTATAPRVLTAAQKKAAIALWMLQKFTREGV